MIEIVDCGTLNTVQDLGRFGRRSIGIGTSGAMDELALRVGNILVGNEEGAAGIELQTFPFRLRFTRTTRFAVTGTDAPAQLDGTPLPPWWTSQAQAGQELLIAAPERGARVYVTIAGGLAVPLVMESRSTHLRGGFGGLDGRALRAGDHLPLGPAAASSAWEIGALPPAYAAGPVQQVRAIVGAEFTLLPLALQAEFWSADWTISAQSDRAGYRLRGPELKLPKPVEMRSYGVVAGIVQLPPSGQPIVQLSDANTAGGYLRLAGIIEADLPRIGQARLGSRIQFVEVDFATAQQAMADIDDYLTDLRQTLGALHIAHTR
ncbi:5-oxoprolinase subunit C family protein [Devosia sp. A449]